MVWSDEFDYTGLPDSTKWIYDTEENSEGWGNGNYKLSFCIKKSS